MCAFVWNGQSWQERITDNETVELQQLNIKRWNGNEWQRTSEDFKGIYLIHFHPVEEIYEVRKIESPKNCQAPSNPPGSEHDIGDGEIVLKPGKAKSGIRSRFINSYSKHWKYKNSEPQTSPRTRSMCFSQTATIYSIAELGEEDNDFFDLVESFAEFKLQRLAG